MPLRVGQRVDNVLCELYCKNLLAFHLCSACAEELHVGLQSFGVFLFVFPSYNLPIVQ